MANEPSTPEVCDRPRLRAAGVSISGIAAQLGAERKTFRRWLALGRAPTWVKPPRRGGVLSAYAAHLDRR